MLPPPGGLLKVGARPALLTSTDEAGSTHPDEHAAALILADRDPRGRDEPDNNGTEP